jgi:hypothetical protein
VVDFGDFGRSAVIGGPSAGWRRPVTAPFWKALAWCEPTAKRLCAADPEFLPFLAGTTATDRHVLAIVALAIEQRRWRRQAISAIAGAVRTQPRKGVLRTALGPYPRGLATVLPKLDRRILSRDRYRLLLQLLAEPKAAKILWHVPRVSARLIDIMDELEPRFRLPA